MLVVFESMPEERTVNCLVDYWRPAHYYWLILQQSLKLKDCSNAAFADKLMIQNVQSKYSILWNVSNNLPLGNCKMAEKFISQKLWAVWIPNLVKCKE